MLAHVDINHLSADNIDLLVRASRGMINAAALNQHQLNSFVDLTKIAFMHGFRVAMLALFFVAVAGLIASLLAKKNTHQQSS